MGYKYEYVLKDGKTKRFVEKLWVQDPATGQRKLKDIVGKTAKERDQKVAELRVSLARGTYTPQTRQTLGQYLDQWLDVIAGQNLRENTVADYRQCVEKHIKPRLGGLKLSDLTTQHIEAAMGRMRSEGYELKLANGKTKHREVGIPTLSRFYTTLHKALRYAEERNLITRNPAAVIKPPKAKAVERPTWTAEQVFRFLDGIKDDRLYPVLLTTAYTGMRRAEVCGLKWRDIDLQAGTLSLVRSLVAIRFKLVESTTKTGRTRLIALDETTVNILIQHRVRMQAERKELGLEGMPGPDDYVFTEQDCQTPIHPEKLGVLFDKLVKKSGLPRVTLHSLRHTHATLLLQQNVHPKVVSERLGHSSIRITMDTYSHAIPALDAKAATAFATLIASSQKSSNNSEASNEEAVTAASVEPTPADAQAEVSVASH